MFLLLNRNTSISCPQHAWSLKSMHCQRNGLNMPVAGVLYIFATLANLIAMPSAVCVPKMLIVVYVKLYCGLLATLLYIVLAHC